MVKVISAVQRYPGLSDEQFYTHWRDVHGPLGAQVPQIRRYLQHHTLPEARDAGPLPPTCDGATVVWYDDVESLRESYLTPEWIAMREDSPTLFDLERGMDVVIAEERVIVDGDTSPSMVKALVIATRREGLSIEEFQQQWYEDHGAIAASLTGFNRYVQNHAIIEIYDEPNRVGRAITHDGWAEFWFDDLEALHGAMNSPGWEQLREHGRTMFGPPTTVIIARELQIIP
jgi:uncharacterized protein (TIGR02118 family)